MIRPLNSKAKAILKVAIPLAVVAFVLFIWASARPVPIQVRVTFTGFITNTANLSLIHASFCVSNAGKCSVFKEGNGLHQIEIKNNPYVGFYGASKWAELKPGEFKTIVVSPPLVFREPVVRWTIWPSPPTVSQREALARLDDGSALPVRLRTNRGPWRLSLSFSKLDWREKLVRNSSRFMQKVRQLVPAKWLERRPVEVHSDWINGPKYWIEEPELMPVATNTANTAPK